MPRASALIAAVALAALPLAMAGKDSNPYCALDQNTIDPAKDLCNPLRYIPSLPLNAAATALYFAVGLVFAYNEWRYKGKYFLCLTIGTFCEAIGLALRILFRNDVHSTGKYIVMYLFVVLSPCAFLAADYILLGRIATHLKADKYMFIPPRKVSWVFVASDIVTFCIQAAGGGLSTSETMHVAGARIFLAGLAAQLASFTLFTCLWVVFWMRVRKDERVWPKLGWKRLFFALGFTCIMFLIRSVFRTIELSEGYAGYLTIHEVYWAALDCLPLWLGISVYTYFWPCKYLTTENALQFESEPGQEAEYAEMASRSSPGGSGLYADKS